MSKMLDKVRAAFTEYNPAPPEEEEEDLLEAAEPARGQKGVEKDYTWAYTTDLHILDGRFTRSPTKMVNRVLSSCTSMTTTTNVTACKTCWRFLLGCWKKTAPSQ